LFSSVARTKNKRPEQVGAFVGLAFSVFSHSLIAVPFQQVRIVAHPDFIHVSTHSFTRLIVHL
ncbi:hypothetical protein ACVWYU_006037, partial [Pseudomonas sp. TE12234]